MEEIEKFKSLSNQKIDNNQIDNAAYKTFTNKFNDQATIDLV